MGGGSTLAFCKKRDPTSISVQATSEATSRRHGLGSSLSQNRTRFPTNGSGTGKNCLGLSERIPNDSRRRRKLTHHSYPANDRADPCESGQSGERDGEFAGPDFSTVREFAGFGIESLPQLDYFI